MANFRKVLRSTIVWSYERGTIQYDIICGLILAFIFLVPPSCFVSKKTDKPGASVRNSAVTSSQTAKANEQEKK